MRLGKLGMRCNASSTQNAKEQVRLAYPKMLRFVLKSLSRACC
jgi:hypothetical protein